jgi:hypothetical protein
LFKQSSFFIIGSAEGGWSDMGDWADDNQQQQQQTTKAKASGKTSSPRSPPTCTSAELFDVAKLRAQIGKMEIEVCVFEYFIYFYIICIQLSESRRNIEAAEKAKVKTEDELKDVTRKLTKLQTRADEVNYYFI